MVVGHEVFSLYGSWGVLAMESTSSLGEDGCVAACVRCLCVCRAAEHDLLFSWLEIQRKEELRLAL